MSKQVQYREHDLPARGSVFLAPLADGRLGVVRVVRTKSERGCSFAFVVPSCWIGSSAVRPSDHEIRLPLFLTHHTWENQREAIWVSTPPPVSFIPVGVIDVSAADDAIQQEDYSAWENLPLQILLQWRWNHDRESLLVEEAEEKARALQARRIADARRAEMLQTLTLDSLSERTWFESWDNEVKDANRAASRQLISDLIATLGAEPKPTRAVARRLLRATVKGFNRLDAKGGFIETTQREDICDALERVMAAARYPELAEEVEALRDW